MVKKWISKHYRQTLRRQPWVDATQVFNSWEEAEAFYHAAKPHGSTWSFWGYPEEVEENGTPS